MQRCKAGAVSKGFEVRAGLSLLHGSEGFRVWGLGKFRVVLGQF